MEEEILPPAAEWRELRDARGRLCAKVEPSLWLLEIRRSDRDLVARFDLRHYLISMENRIIIQDDQGSSPHAWG